VVEARQNGTYCVELSNGHRLTGFVTGRGKKDLAGVRAGDKVKLRLTPYDLSMGRIVTENKTI
jgi:translation initiation factor IF-1